MGLDGRKWSWHGRLSLSAQPVLLYDRTVRSSNRSCILGDSMILLPCLKTGEKINRNRSSKSNSNKNTSSTSTSNRKLCIFLSFNPLQ